METNQKAWNRQQKEFRNILLGFDRPGEAVRLFLIQHAMLHSAQVSQSDTWSYEDEILDDMSAEQIRRIPSNCEHSIAWVIWHLARIEDVTMNQLVAGTPQLLQRDNWLERMKITTRHTGNAMDEASMAELSAAIDLEAMRAYRVAVGRRTREIVRQIEPEMFKQKVEPSRFRKVWDEGAVVEAASSIVNYWSKRNIAGLLLMPPTRHNFLHLNEAARLKQRR
ncbi:MAG: DinB family protein [Anaerolineaceae bacterium]|nr:DinB family protein [Anaerolineaceae bacterium]